MSNQYRKNIEWLFFLLAIVLIGFLSLIFVEVEKYLDVETKSYVLDLVTQVTPDLIAALIIFTFIYWFLTRRGLDTQNQFKSDVIEQINEGIKKNMSAENIKQLAFELNNTQNPVVLHSKNQSEIFKFGDKLKTAKEVWINGYSCRHLIGENRLAIEEAILRGTKFKFVLNHPSCYTATIMGNRTVKKHLLLDDVQTSLGLINLINKLGEENNKRESIEVKFTKWIPSCSMIIINPNEENTQIKINVYPVFHSTSKSLGSTSFIVSNNHDKKIKNFYIEQYNRLWNLDSEYQKDIEITNPSNYEKVLSKDEDILIGGIFKTVQKDCEYVLFLKAEDELYYPQSKVVLDRKAKTWTGKVKFVGILPLKGEILLSAINENIDAVFNKENGNNGIAILPKNVKIIDKIEITKIK